MPQTLIAVLAILVLALLSSILVGFAHLFVDFFSREEPQLYVVD